jgi:hypothetical protein
MSQPNPCIGDRNSLERARILEVPIKNHQPPEQILLRGLRKFLSIRIAESLRDGLTKLSLPVYSFGTG